MSTQIILQIENKTDGVLIEGSLDLFAELLKTLWVFTGVEGQQPKSADAEDGSHDHSNP